MADTQQPTPEVGANTNAAAEKDVQDVLAELKAEEVKDAGQEVPVTTEQEKKDEATNGAQVDAAEADEEAKIIAAANKLGQESVSDEKAKQEKGDQLDSRGGPGGEKKRVNYRDNIKSDVTTLEETSDPEQIRKQVGNPSQRRGFSNEK